MSESETPTTADLVNSASTDVSEPGSALNKRRGDVEVEVTLTVRSSHPWDIHYYPDGEDTGRKVIDRETSTGIEDVLEFVESCVESGQILSIKHAVRVLDRGGNVVGALVRDRTTEV